MDAQGLAMTSNDSSRDDVVAKLDAAMQVVSALCKREIEWIMSIPARPDKDPDLIISGALCAAKSQLATLQQANEQPQEQKGE